MGSRELPANLFRAHPPSSFQRFSFDFVYAFCGFAGSCGVRYHSLGVQNFSFCPPAHRDVGAKVRQTIKELGGTMPEELPSVESVKKLEAKARKSLKKPKL